MKKARRSQRAVVSLGALAAIYVLSCRPATGPGLREASCVSACRDDVSSCTEATCERGCNFVLDRLVEGYQREILLCVASRSDHACTDRAWAECAVRAPSLRVASLIDAGVANGTEHDAAP